jgi:hypothetical protein
VEGLPVVRARRGDREGPVLLTGPGKVGSALGLDTSFSGAVLFGGGGLEVHDAAPARTLLIGPRVGVDYAEPVHRDAPWRIALAGTPWVSQRASLRPLDRTLAKYLAAERLLDLAPRRLAAPNRVAHGPSARDLDPRSAPVGAITRRRTRS